MLVPQDVRERKGSFFTPKKWVELSQKYIADVLGEDWQDDYYIWDCCAGTGNLLKGLSNKRNVFASTLDKGDVGIMKELADQNVLPVFENNIFQFDFLNDDLQSEKVPEQLRKILSDEQERKKLVIYINPPYAEAASVSTLTGFGENKTNVSNTNKTWYDYINTLGKASRELFVQFFIRIYFEIQGCFLCEFSKVKHIQSPNFDTFRKFFKARLEKMFVVPGNTFDNVKGQFPIGFFIWNTNIEESFEECLSDVYDENANSIMKKSFCNYSNYKTINEWFKNFVDKENDELSAMCCVGTDFQHQNYVNIDFKDYIKGVGNAKGIAKFGITKNNFLVSCIYFSVRLCIPQYWLNDRDQFLYPNDGWKTDQEFQSDCLAYTLLHGQNRISATHGTNHWIPFTESEVNAKQAFESTFMTDFMKGRLKKQDSGELELTKTESSIYDGTQKIVFSQEAKAVLEAGKELYKYYYSKPHITKEANNASFYDIRAAFQGIGTSGKMNTTSTDEKYNELIADLRAKQKLLAKKIQPKVYEYGFLK